MEKLKKWHEIAEASIARYELNEDTTEFGAIIFDDSRGGNISNTNIYRLSDNSLWTVDFYLEKELGIIKSIWLVHLSSEQLISDDELVIPENSARGRPSFDLSLWENVAESQWPIVHSDAELKIYHNGSNLIHFNFGISNDSN